MSSKSINVIIGVDVGGTNTDAVVLSQTGKKSTVLASVKKLTTADVTSGVRNAVYSVLKQVTDNGHTVAVVQVNIGTTHFVNAAVQGKDLVKVSVIRLCGSTSHSLPPFSDFPIHLKNIICGSVHLCDGGYRYDGKEIDPVDKNQIADIVNTIRSKGIKNIVLSGVFSPVKPDQEDEVCQLITSLYTEASVTLSHKIGHIGLLERENAAVLNECLKPLCKKTIEGFQSALRSINLTCPMYLTQNDGTIIRSEDALSYPVCTFASGPTNSMRGAAYLSDVKDAIVIDIGGTTTDVGVLKNKFPRESSTHVRIGGVRTNFRMPDVVSIGLGGGSYVKPVAGSDGLISSVTVGPLSAGYKLQNEALIFGKGAADPYRSLTASDIAVAAGMLDLGTRDNVAHLSADLIALTLAKIGTMIEEAIDMVKLSGETMPVILVGGGSVLVKQGQVIEGASDVIIPEHSGVANAIGAALSQVSGCVDNVVSLQDMVNKEEMEEAEQKSMSTLEKDADALEITHAAERARKPFFEEARKRAIETETAVARQRAELAGADVDTIEITEKEDVAVAYIPGQAMRIKIKAVGNLKNIHSGDGEQIGPWLSTSVEPLENTTSLPEGYMQKQQYTSSGKTLSEETLPEDATKHPMEPEIDPNTGEWILTAWDIEAIVIGAGIFGCGGGGNPHIGRLRALAYSRKGKKIRVISPQRLYANADPLNDLVGVVAFMGAPLIMYEQLVSSRETNGALKCMQDLYSVGGYENAVPKNVEEVEIKKHNGAKFIENYRVSLAKPKKIIALMSGEIGGMNAIEPLMVAADAGIPVIDSDGMGRAFPELQHFAPYLYGVPPYPAALVDDRGTRAVILECSSAKQLENHFRDTVIGMGCSAGLALTSLSKKDIMETTVLYSMSHARILGDAILRARIKKESPIEAILKTEKSIHVLTGKIRDVQRTTSGGFNTGSVTIEGIDNHSGQSILVEFQNENLVIFPLGKDTLRGRPIASVPDLITIVDADTAEPIPTEEVRYGTRVAVLVLAAPDILKTERALKYVGPAAFHYEDVDFVPIGDAHPVKPIPPTELC